jgi:hypothetical protein
VGKFVVIVGDPSPAITAGGTVLDGWRTDPAGAAVAVLQFADDEAAYRASLLVGGTLFGGEWAAREHARHKATDERRWGPDDLRHDFGYNDRVFSLI